MEPMVIAKQMVGLQKTAFDNSFNAMLLLQEQTERTVNMFLEHTTWPTAEGKKVITDWVKTYNKGCDDFKKLVDESFKNVEAFLAEATKPEATKPEAEKPEAEKPEAEKLDVEKPEVETPEVKKAEVKKAQTKKTPKTKSK